MPVTTGISQTTSSATSTTTTSTTISPLPSVALINLILADVNAILPNFNGLVSSYRLLVGAAEEVRRTPEVCHDVFERAVKRYDNTGLLLDVLLELLCCKIVFSSELLEVTCGPVDLIRYLLTCLDGDDPPCRAAETVVGLEALKRLQDKFCDTHYCLPDYEVLCPQPTPPPPLHAPPSPPPPPVPIICESDIAEIIETKLVSILNKHHFFDRNQSNEEESSSYGATMSEMIPPSCSDNAATNVETEVNVRYTSRLHPKYLPGTTAKKRRSDQ